MSRPLLARAALLAALIVSAGALGACGKTGALERPRPLFGQARAAPAAAGNEQDPSRPIETVDPRDIGRMDPGPQRGAPIQGQGPDPTGVAPPTALPDPYARPGR